MLTIPKTIVEEIFVQARAEAPLEACGYLGGKDGVVSVRFPLYNVDQSAEHFSFDPKEQFKAVKAARAQGLALIAVYHSHPQTPARPSDEDIKLAFDPNISYVIASLADEQKDIKAFKIRNAVVEREELKVL